MAEPTYTVKALGAPTWVAFAALVERNNGIFGGCWFIRDRQIGKHRWVVTRVVEPRDEARGSVP